MKDAKRHEARLRVERMIWQTDEPWTDRLVAGRSYDHRSLFLRSRSASLEYEDYSFFQCGTTVLVAREALDTVILVLHDRPGKRDLRNELAVDSVFLHLRDT